MYMKTGYGVWGTKTVVDAEPLEEERLRPEVIFGLGRPKALRDRRCIGRN